MRRTLLVLAAVGLVGPAARADVLPDRRVNAVEAAEVTSLCNAQHDVALAAHGDSVVAVWNDPGQCQLHRIPVPLTSGAGWARSADGGASWTDGGLLSFPTGSTGSPTVAAHPDGTFLALAEVRDYGDPASAGTNGRPLIAAYRSVDGGTSWGSADEISAVPTDVVFAGVHAPVIAVDSVASSPRRGTVYAMWNQYGDSGFIGDTFLARSFDAGVTYDAPRLVAAGRLSGADIAFGPNGEVYVTWTANQTVFLIRSLDGGTTFSEPIVVGLLRRVGHLVDCGVIQGFAYVLNGNLTAYQWASVAVDTYAGEPGDANPHLGRLFVTVASDGTGADEADVFLATSDDGGDRWSPLRRLNDDATTTDQFHPSIAVDALGRVGTIWQDRRSSASASPSNWGIDTYGRVSLDGGATFGPAMRLSDVTSDPPASMGVPYFSDVCTYPHQRNALIATGDGFLGGWADNRNGTYDLPDLDVFVEDLPAD